MFPENLKKLRTSYGLTQKELADELGTSQPTYMKWELGRVSPTLRTVEKIAELFDVPVSQLVYNNMISIENILDAEHIDFFDIPLSKSEVEELKFHIQMFIDAKLSNYPKKMFGKGFELKSGKMVGIKRNIPED